MTLFICAMLWLWQWLRPRSIPREGAAVTCPPSLKPDFLTEARKTHPRDMEAVDFASWELQMEVKEW